MEDMLGFENPVKGNSAHGWDWLLAERGEEERRRRRGEREDAGGEEGETAVGWVRLGNFCLNINPLMHILRLDLLLA